MKISLAPPPQRESILDGTETVQIGQKWYLWLYDLWARTIAATILVGTPVSLTDQHATIPTTTFYTTAQAGTYRISTYLQVTTIDGVSSSALLTLTWRYKGQTLTKAFAAMNGDTLTTYDSQTLAVRADGGTAIRYGVVYASNTPDKMHFSADLSVEQGN